jgi:hypothetical protein
MDIPKEQTSQKRDMTTLHNMVNYVFYDKGYIHPDRDNKKDGEPAAPELFSTSFITLSVVFSSEETFLSYFLHNYYKKLYIYM